MSSDEEYFYDDQDDDGFDHDDEFMAGEYCMLHCCMFPQDD
jgi:hypothetical protein